MTRFIVRPGFPPDDEFSINLDDGGEANLDIFYPATFIENERWDDVPHRPQIILEHTPVYRGSLTGTVLQDGNEVASFAVTEANLFCFTSVVDGLQIGRCNLNCITGELEFNCNLDDFDLQYSYEYMREEPEWYGPHVNDPWSSRYRRLECNSRVNWPKEGF